MVDILVNVWGRISQCIGNRYSKIWLVSTGIIYQYFNDKIDIFIVSVRDYADTIMFPI